ncbi:MAG: class I SAM-dependent methyltransferase [Candidatus Omnitrophota bacterium]|nr:class I SAM-dependent methyltransferase [Candidatus Omnitrophota bacterium]
MENKREYFDSSWTRTFDPPRDIAFVVYSKKTWRALQDLLPYSGICVDFGCGGGTLLYNIARVSKDHNLRLLGIDLSINALKQAKNFVPQANLLCADFLKLPLRANSCNLILSTMTIEHVDDHLFLREIYSVLKSGGYLIVNSVLKRPLGWYYLKNTSGESVLESSHLREYKSKEEFIRLFENERFEVQQCNIVQISFPLIDPIFKFLMNKSGWYFLRHTTSCTIGNFLRKLTRFPILGYYAIEVCCKKIG